MDFLSPNKSMIFKIYQNKWFIDVSESVCKSGSSKKMFHVRRICLPTDRRGAASSRVMHGSHGGEARWGNVKNSAVDGTHRGTIRNLILAINFCLHFTPVWHKIAQSKRRLCPLRPRDRFWRTSAYFWILTARSARPCAQTALHVFAFSCKRLVCCFCALPVSSGRLSWGSGSWTWRESESIIFSGWIVDPLYLQN